MNTFKKPLYTIYPHIYCSATILVNDVPIIDWYGKDTEEGGYGGDLPINQALLQSGTYEVVAKMFPRTGKKTLTNKETLFIDFYLADSDQWKKTRHQFHPEIRSPWDGLDENINYPYFEIKTKIDVELPFVLDGWQNSVDLTTIKEEKLFQEVLMYYNQLHSVLASHNATRFLELSKEKMALQEQAFYFSEGRKKSFLNSVAELFNQKLEILPLNSLNLKLEILGYGKLVRLLRLDGSSALQYKSPDPENQSNVELDIKLHMRNIDKGLSII